jgi:uncharacterized repeat protein (TIGR03803 family)
MKQLRFGKTAYIVAAFCAAAVIASTAQTVTPLVSFDGTNGVGLYEGSSLIQGTDGNFYGASIAGGSAYTGPNTGYGTVFKMTPEGTITTLYNFCSKAKCADGYAPNGSLVQGTDGNFYGTTQLGGKGIHSDCLQGCGTVFKITPAGKLTTLYSFCSQTNCTDGEFTYAGLIQAANGNFYGTNFSGGANGWGAVFKITSSGQLTIIHSFDQTDGLEPTRGLMQASNGDIYGTTSEGGANQGGTIFKISPAGEFESVYSFPGSFAEGYFADPNTPIQATNGKLYGTTFSGGEYTFGSVFDLTLSGQFTNLYSFCPESGCYDGAYPRASLVQGTDENFYGVAGGGTYDYGLIFQITPEGTRTTLYTFCTPANCTAGGQPPTALVQGTDGLFYGTTGELGGTSCSCGTAYSLSMGLGPFVEAQLNFGKVGRVVNILGNGLTGTTSVTFNGVAATFTVVSDTYIKATVPSGATTGTIEVTTPTGTLSSNVAFRVLP